MNQDDDQNPETPYDLRLSFRSYRRFLPKLELIAKARNLFARGKPNLSAVLNRMIESYDVTEDAKIVKKMDATAAKKETP